MAHTKDTMKTLRILQNAGMAEAQAEAVTQAIQDSHNDTITKDYLGSRLSAEIGNLRGDLYRALWIQGGAIQIVPKIFLASQRQRYTDAAGAEVLPQCRGGVNFALTKQRKKGQKQPKRAKRPKEIIYYKIRFKNTF